MGILRSIVQWMCPHRDLNWKGALLKDMVYVECNRCGKIIKFSFEPRIIKRMTDDQGGYYG